MVREEYLAILHKGVEIWNKWRENHLDEEIDLQGADLQNTTLEGINLSHVNLEKANLSKARMEKANLSSARLKNANLSYAHLDHANLSHAHLDKANLALAHLENAVLIFANMNGADLRGAYLKKASLEDANLQNANLTHAHLEKAVLACADCTNAQFVNAFMNGTNLTAVNLEKANVASVKFDHNIFWRILKETGLNPRKIWKRRFDFILDTTLRCNGAYAACYGSQRFAVFLKGQDLLEETMETRKGRIVCFIWWLLADCGRSFARWAFWTCMIVILFAITYWSIGAQNFRLSVLAFDFKSMLYYSVVTFSTLGFGDIIPRTPLASLLTASEVFLGYFMLGGLISIFATKIIRTVR